MDLNAPLPTTVINFLIRKLAGILLYMIQKQVVKVQTDHQCSHALRIRSNLAFYRDWLLPKLRYEQKHLPLHRVRALFLLMLALIHPVNAFIFCWKVT